MRPSSGLFDLAIRALRRVATPWLLACGLLLPLHMAQAAAERYEYDGLGRLIRVIDASNKVTEYEYDAAGNILAVRTDGTAQPPTVSSVSPTALRRGSSSRVTLVGTQLATAALSADDPELLISRVSRTATSISFDLQVSSQAAMGLSVFRVSSIAGTATIGLQIRPAMPQASVAPLPIAISPSAGAAGFDLTLDHADDESHQFSLSVVRPDVATVSPATLSIAAGQLSARFAVRGLTGGNTELRFSSPTLGVLQVPIFVTINPEGISSARAALVGVEVARPAQPQPEVSAWLPAPLVGVTMGGSVWLDTQPRYLSLGATQTLTVIGEGLPSDLTAALQPDQGLSVGAVTVAPDGKRASISVTVDASASTGLRNLELRSAGAVLRPAQVGADDIDVVLPRPQIQSVAPIYLTAGSTVSEFVIRGRYLQDVTSVEVRGAAGLRLGSTLTVSPDGGSLTVGLQVLPSAAAGPRVIVLGSPSGNSDETPSAANTVTVYDDNSGWKNIQNLSADVVGVELAQSPGDPQAVSSVQVAPLVGVTFGSVISEMTPQSIAKGDTRRLRFQGWGLQGVDAVRAEPATGLSLDAITAAPDGQTVEVTVTAAADAPLGLRRLVVSAAGVTIPYAAAQQPLLLVTPVLPVLESLDPPTVKPGSTQTLVLRGRNFLNAQAVRVQPAESVSVGAPDVNAEGTELRVTLIVAAAAGRGARTVSVLTAAGETNLNPGPNNQLLIGDPQYAVNGLTAAAVGVQLAQVAPEPSVPAQLQAALVGVELTQSTVPSQQDLLVQASNTGVLLGAGVIDVAPTGLLREQTVELTLRGHGLPNEASLRILPSGALTLQGTAQVSPDGSSLRQTVAVKADAPLQVYEVQVLDELGKPIAVLGHESRLQLHVAAALPEIVSIEPILARQGDVIVLRVRGLRLKGVDRVEAEPAGALIMGDTPSVNAEGTELTIPVAVRANAQTGAYTIRVFNRFGGSSSLASPANTFTVYVKEGSP